MKINYHQFSLDTDERKRLWEERRRSFKDYCVNRYQWFHYPKWNYVAPFPLHVDFEASFRCNLSCPMCFRPHIQKKEYGDMDFHLYKKGIDECVKNDLYSIRLSWRGESTLNPHLVDMIEYAKRKGIKEVSFITNGKLLEHDLIIDLINVGLDYLTISIDGLEEHYNHLRKPITFEEITRKIRNLYYLKNSIGNGLPLVKIQGIWTYVKKNPSLYYNHFKDITDNISFNPEHDYSVKKISQNSAITCQYPWQRITISWNGDIPLCIADWNQYTLLGNLSNNSIKNIWLGAAIENYRKMHRNKERLNIQCCKQCYRTTTEAIGDKPEGRC